MGAQEGTVVRGQAEGTEAPRVGLVSEHLSPNLLSCSPPPTRSAWLSTDFLSPPASPVWHRAQLAAPKMLPVKGDGEDSDRRNSQRTPRALTAVAASPAPPPRAHLPSGLLRGAVAYWCCLLSQGS